MARIVHTTVARLRLGDYVTTGAGSAYGVVETMTQLASLPSGRLWDLTLTARGARHIVTLSDDDRVTVER